MMRKYQVFMSSTYLDLQIERQAAVEAILATGCIPAGMELFCAGDQSQWKVIQRWIDSSDIFLLLLGGRYGSIEPRTGKSYTHLEYEYALSRRMPHCALVLSDSAIEAKVRALGKIAVETTAPAKYASFRAKVVSKMVSFVEEAKDVRIHLPRAIAEVRSRYSLVGWVQADAAYPDEAALVEEIKALKRRNSQLEARLGKSLAALETLPCRQIFAREHEIVVRSIQYSPLGQQRRRMRKCECTLGEIFTAIAPHLLRNSISRINPVALSRQIAGKIAGVDIHTLKVPEEECYEALCRLGECGLVEHYMVPTITDGRGVPADFWRLTQAGRSLAHHQRLLRALSRQHPERAAQLQPFRHPRRRRGRWPGHYLVIEPRHRPSALLEGLDPATLIKRD